MIPCDAIMNSLISGFIYRFSFFCIAILPPINKTETLVTTYQSMLDACKPFLYTKSNYETYINEMSDEDFRRMFVNMEN